jgi:hypothetical protein
MVLSRAVDDSKVGKDVRDAVRDFVTRGGKRR